MRAVVAIVALLGASCDVSRGDAVELAVWSDAEATRVGREIATDLGAGHLEAVAARFCDQSDAGLGLARTLLAPAVGRSDLVVRRVEPAWAGKEPYFYVELSAGEGWAHGLGVRARDGCLERAVGERGANAAKGGANAGEGGTVAGLEAASLSP